MKTSIALIATQSSEMTMSSLEIAKLTGKEHFNVLVDIRKMLEELELGDLKFQDTYLSAQKKQMPCFNLPKRECFILVSGYNLKLRAAIIDRWQELEGAAPKPLTQIEQATARHFVPCL